MSDDGGWDGWLSPRTWIPAGAILGLAMLAAGLLAGWQWLGDDKQTVQVITCDLREEGCEPRVPVHWHADFALFINGEQYDFNQERFFSNEEEVISANVHIHEPRVNVVHVHRSLTRWSEFLDSVGFDLVDPSTIAGQAGAPSCLETPEGERYCEGEGNTFKFIVNGVKSDGIADSDVTDLDRVLISYGPESFEEVMAEQWPQVSDEACIPSGRCLERGIDVDEPCGPFSTTCS